MKHRFTHRRSVTRCPRAKRAGRPPRRTESICPWQADAARQWDRRFGWYRRRGYPCAGCMQRAVCEYTDQYCPAFAAWFSEAYRQAAAALREAAARQ